jgi:hypothetical protein
MEAFLNSLGVVEITSSMQTRSRSLVKSKEKSTAVQSGPDRGGGRTAPPCTVPVPDRGGGRQMSGTGQGGMSGTGQGGCPVPDMGLCTDVVPDRGGCPVPDMGLCTDVVPDRGGCPVPDMGLGTDVPRKQIGFEDHSGTRGWLGDEQKSAAFCVCVCDEIYIYMYLEK